MKYCDKCLKVYPDDVTSCNCRDYLGTSASYNFITLPIEQKCHECGSTVNLTYSKPWTCGSYTFGNECTCEACREKHRKERERQEAMKYLILDSYRDETEFCDDKEAVEKHLEYYTQDCDASDLIENVIILKLEVVEDALKAEQFKDPYNTHLVIMGGETYRVEEVIEPEIEDGLERTIRW
jgi:hypothetical protein